MAKLFFCLFISWGLVATASAVEYHISDVPAAMEVADFDVHHTFSYSRGGITDTKQIRSFRHAITIHRVTNGEPGSPVLLPFEELGGNSFGTRRVAGSVSGLRPGIYQVRSSYRVDWVFDPNCFNCTPRTIQGEGPYKQFIVTGIPDGVDKVLTDPAVLDVNDCNASFSLVWQKDINDSWLDAGGEVYYQIQEESAPDNVAFSGNWLTIESKHPSVVNTAATRDESLETYNFRSDRAPGRKYRYRVFTYFELGSAKSRLVLNHEEFGSIRKHSCSSGNITQNTDVFSQGNSDVINIAKPNSQGISLNRIDAYGGTGFNLHHKPLVIRNLSGQTGKAAELIVIESSRVSIRQPISILGENAAVLIINNNRANTALFECTQRCEFHNVNRLTLANAYRDGNYGTGTLQTNNHSTMNVNGLLAPGAHSVELLAGKLNVSGFLSNHLKAKRNFPSGQYELDTAGNLSAGIGAISLYSGGLAIEYATLNIKRAWPLNGSDLSVLNRSVINGNIEAANISMVTTENINVGAHLNTNADIFSSTPYKKKSYIHGDMDKLYTPQENIRLETLGTHATLNMNGSVTTRATASLVSRNHLNIRNSLYAGTLNLITADGKLYIPYGVSVMADHINAASGWFENNGMIAAKVKADIGADLALINQFGGRIMAPTLKLTSTRDYVRNGSLVPYRQSQGEADFDDRWSSPSAADYYSDGTYQDIKNDSANAQNTIKVPDLSAKLVAGTLEISAATRFENINPYFEVNRTGADWNNSVPFSKRAMQQVGLYGTNEISIAAGDKVLNSSAEIMQLDPAGVLKIATKNLHNQRYRTEVILNYSEELFIDYVNLCSHTSAPCDPQVYQDKTKLVTNPVLYSPPGLLYVAGNIQATDNTELSTVNDFSFFEVMGNADFTGRRILSVGKVKTELNNFTIHNTCGIESTNSYGQKTCESTEHYGGSTSDIGTHETLFRVHGTFNGPTVELAVDNDEVALAFIARATSTSVASVKAKKENNTLSEFVRINMHRIQNYIESVKHALLSAWDVVTDWFN